MFNYDFIEKIHFLADSTKFVPNENIKTHTVMIFMKF